jgi:hypothetical protein
MKHVLKACALSIATVIVIFLFTSVASAACTTPAGNAGDVVFSSLSGQMAYCNGTSWVGMGASQPVGFGTLTPGDFCLATSGTQISCTTATIPASSITAIAGLSVLGTATTATAAPGPITGTANQVLTVNSAGTGLVFGSLNLSSAAAITGTLGATNGGTGLAAYTTGDILYASATNTLSRLSIGTTGWVLTASPSGPVWAASTGGVTSFSAGTTGLTPSTPSTGAIVLAGTLGVPNGGTGLATLTSNVIYKGAGTSVMAVSGLTDNGTIVSSSESIDATGKSYITEIADGSVATALNTLAKLDTSGNATKALVSDTDGIVGIVVGGAGTTGTTAQIAINGQATCVFDGTAVVGHFVTISSTTAGDCHDTGATRSTTAQTIGRVLTGGTTATVALGLNGAGGGAAAGATTNVQYNNGGAFAGDASFTYTTPGAVGIGTAAGSTGVLKMSGTTSGTVSIQPAAVAGTYNFILPTTPGTAGQPLLSNAGSSAMAFGTLGFVGGGTGTSTQFTTGSVVFTGASGIYTQNNAQFFWDNTNNRLGIGTATPTQGLTVFGNIDAGGTNGYLTEIANAGTPGTTVNKLAKPNTSGAAVISAITDIDGMLGIVVGETAGGTSAVTTGNAQIATSGQASCIFDGQTVAGDYVSISATVAGDCLDGGTSRPLTNQTIGRVLTANSGVGTAATVAISLSGSGQGGVPTGTIMAFAGTCPAGWTEYTAARGRFLRGIDNGAGVDPSGTRTPGNQQADAFQGHYHNLSGTINENVPGGSGQLNVEPGATSAFASNTVTTPITDGTDGTPRTATETRPVNVAVTFCQYTGGSPLTTTASGATNYVARFTSATTIGTGTLYDSGSAVGLNTASPQNLLDVNGAASIGYNVAAPTNGLIVSGNVGIGSTAPGAALTVTGGEALNFGTDYSTTGVQNNVNLTATSSVRYTGSSAATFTGIIAGTSNVAGSILHLHNASSSALTISNQNASSTATNRIITGTGSDMVMAANSSVIMQYDGTAALWRVIGGSGGGIPAGTTGQVQFNSGANAFAASTNLTWDNTNFRLGIGSATPTVGLDLSQKTDALALPVGTSGQRPTCSVGVNGALRYNSTIPAVEACVNGAWVSVGAGGGQLLGVYSSGAAVTNASIVFTGAAGSVPSFSGSTLTLPSNTAYIVVEEWGGGGGGGGHGSTNTSGGGGNTSYFCEANSSCNSTGNATFYATGGGGGSPTGLLTTSNTQTGAAGGAGSGGDENLVGGPGVDSFMGVASNWNGAGGPGGSAPRGGGGGAGGATEGGNGSLGGSYGGGGGGAGSGTSNGDAGAAGGGGGGYVRKFINNPGSTCSSNTCYYTIGSAGSAGTGSTTNGGAGGAGGITITAYSSGSTQAFNMGTQATGTLGVANGGTGTTTPFTQGSAIFAGAGGVYSQDNANFFYDATNHRLGIGTTTPLSALQINGVETLAFGTDYSTTGTQNNVNLGATSSVRYTGSGVATFTGIIAGTSNIAGSILHLHNATAYALTVSNQNASSTASNEVITGTGSDLVMASNSSIMMQYDGAASVWRVIGGSGGSSGGSATVWSMIASTDIATAATNYTFSGLNGDTDGEYQVVARFVSGASVSTNYYLLPNADATAADYGQQIVYANGSTASGQQLTSQPGLYMAAANATGKLGFSNMTIYAKSGQMRSAINTEGESYSGSTIAYMEAGAEVWTNTASPITSLQVLATQASGLGVGTHLELWTKRSVGGSGGSATPGGTTGQVQFNNAGVFGGTTALTYAASGTNLLAVAQTVTDNPLAVRGMASQSGDLTQWQNTGGTPLARISAAGDITTVGKLNLTLGTDLTTTGAPQNNVNVGAQSSVRYSGTGTATFTGIITGTVNLNGTLLTLHNASSSVLTVSNQNASSTVANEIITGTGSDLAMAAGSSIMMQYDGTASRWRVIGGTGSGGGGQLLGVYSSSTSATNNQVVFTGAAGSAPSFSAGVLTLPSNTAYITVEEWGGGGGGGGGSALWGGSAAGAGGYVSKFISGPSGTYYYTIGAAGAAGGSGTNGGSAAQSCFGTNTTACTAPIISATGGTLGNCCGNAPGVGGIGTGGDINLAGQGGQAGTDAQSTGIGGVGGSSPNGGGGGFGAAPTSTSVAGGNGGAYGGGGGGGAGSAASVGGAGGAGGIKISVYSSGSTQAFNLGTQATGTLGVANGGTGDTSALTQGSVVFAGASGVYSQDNANFFYDATNHRLGIGTTSPQTPLEVSSTSTGYVGIFAGNNGGAAATVIGARLGGGAIQAYTSDTQATVANLGLQESGGNVGIGTTIPGRLLTMAGALDFLRLDRPVNTSGNGYAMVEWSTAGVGKFLMGLDSDSVAGAGADKLQIVDSAFSSTPVMTFTGGNVGIGTTSPQAPLDVASTISSDVWYNSAASCFAYNYSNFSSGFCLDAGGLGSTTPTSIHAAGLVVATGFGALSDFRKKTNIENITPEEGVDFVEHVHPVNFFWKADGKNGNVNHGYIAQQMLAAGYGSLVNALKDDGMKPETDIFDGKKVDSPAGLVLNANYEGAIPYLHAALKQILTEIESIKTEAKNMTVEMADIVQHLASHDHQMEALKAENDNLRAANDNEAAQIKALVTRLDALENARRK